MRLLLNLNVNTISHSEVNLGVINPMSRTLLIIGCFLSLAIAKLNISQQNEINNTASTSNNTNEEISTTMLISIDATKTEITNQKNVTEVSTDEVLIESNVTINSTVEPHIFMKIHRTLTRSKDAVWATMTLTFMCVLLLLAVAQSRMWKNYRGPQSQGVPLPNFNERVLYRDVMQHKLRTLKQMFQKKETDISECELLLSSTNDWDNENTDIPVSST